MAEETAFAWRRTLWWIMLALLGASVALAVVVVLSRRADVGQLVAYVILAAVLTGLMFGSSKLVDIKRTRYTGVFAMAALLVESVLLLVFWGTEDFSVGTSAYYYVAVAIPATAMFQATRHRGGKVAGFAGLALLAASFLIFTVAASSASESCYTISAALWMLAVGLSIGLAGAGVDRRYWRWVGAAAGLAAFIVAVVNATLDQFMLWKKGNWDLYLFFVVMLAIALAIALANLNMLWPLPARYKWLRRGTIAVGFAAAAVCAWAACDDSDRAETESRVGIVLAICAVAASLAVAVLSLFGRKPEPLAPTLRFTELSIVCPHCQTAQAVAIGESACCQCGLKFLIDAREPRCAACGYVLLMNRSSVCPECGAVV